ncbi:MAG TPA: hypothetical protein VK255_03435 [Patescibacteria group bacterium]|nr:hypothetical protein [Patescibacteria group bacterium]
MSKIGKCEYCHYIRERNNHHIIPQRFISTSPANRGGRKRKDIYLLDRLFPEPEHLVNGHTSLVCHECHKDADALIPLDLLMTPDKYYLLDEKLKGGEEVTPDEVGIWVKESCPEIKKRRKSLLIEQKSSFRKLFFALAALRQAVKPFS